MAYTVVKGDTLGAIAKANGMTLAELLALNPDISDPNVIGIGQNIVTDGGSSDGSSGGETSTPKGGSAQTLRGREDIDFFNIRVEYRETFGKEPSSTARVSALRAEIRTFLAEGGTPISAGAAEGESQANVGVGNPDTDPDTPDLTILTGKEMKWYFDKGTGKWYVEYGLPNSNRTALFEASPEDMDALFGENNRPTDFTQSTFKELTSIAGVTFSGNIAEMEGTGSFEDEVARVTQIALDDGSLPEWAAKDGVAMDIIYTAQSEGKSLDWTLTQLSKTNSFQERFPGMTKFIGDNNMTLLEGITGYLEYETGVTQALKASGLNFDASPEMIGNLLNAGHSLTVINNTVEGFRRMQAYGPALDSFNQVLAASGAAPITSIQDMFDFVQGNSSAAVYELYEASSIAEAAEGAGLGKIFSAEDALSFAESGTFDLTTATQGMRKASEMLLRLRHEVDVGKFGLDTDELIDISLGQTPRSGRAESEIMESVNRAVLSAQGKLQAKAKAFTSFGASGTPQASSLRSLRSKS